MYPAFFLLMYVLFVGQGGYLYGYQQGVLGQALVMTSFLKKFPSIAHNEGAQGWLTSILQLGGWIGSLTSGILCEVFSRKITLFSGALWVVLGSYLTAGASTPSYLYAGRFFTGINSPGATYSTRLNTLLIHLSYRNRRRWLVCYGSALQCGTCTTRDARLPGRHAAALNYRWYHVGILVCIRY